MTIFGVSSINFAAAKTSATRNWRSNWRASSFITTTLICAWGHWKSSRRTSSLTSLFSTTSCTNPSSRRSLITPPLPSSEAAPWATPATLTGPANRSGWTTLKRRTLFRPPWRPGFNWRLGFWASSLTLPASGTKWPTTASAAFIISTLTPRGISAEVCHFSTATTFSLATEFRLSWLTCPTSRPAGPQSFPRSASLSDPKRVALFSGEFCMIILEKKLPHPFFFGKQVQRWPQRETGQADDPRRMSGVERHQVDHKQMDAPLFANVQIPLYVKLRRQDLVSPTQQRRLQNGRNPLPITIIAFFCFP